MNANKIAKIIILVAIAVTVIWGVAGGWSYSWMAMLVGVIVAGIVKVIGGKE
jgi:hypothetical protein